MSTTSPVPKINRRDQARSEFAKMIQLVCARGFHGTASVAVSVQDGHIQHTKVSVERMVR